MLPMMAPTAAPSMPCSSTCALAGVLDQLQTHIRSGQAPRRIAAIRSSVIEKSKARRLRGTWFGSRRRVRQSGSISVVYAATAWCSQVVRSRSIPKSLFPQDRGLGDLRQRPSTG